MPENVLGHSGPIFYNLQYLPKKLVSYYLDFFGSSQTSVKEASVWQVFF